jgi:hypothetical protein
MGSEGKPRFITDNVRLEIGLEGSSPELESWRIYASVLAWPSVGNGRGRQSIGGQCLSGADCSSACCAGPSGICSGPGASRQAGKTGCGFVAKRSLSLPRRRFHVMDEEDVE